MPDKSHIRNFFPRKKKAMSPLIATLLLVVFALVIGAMTMNWGKLYVENIKDTPQSKDVDSAILISIRDIDTPLKQLQIDYITQKISMEEYIEREKELISG
ncbi:hypothetical protein KY358_02460 [Candidatus Woesearchaeota archaeon]|nr:hypothetical protein [Candidatus Woesearchaeota archaeon]